MSFQSNQHHSQDHDESNPFLIPFFLILAFSVVELLGGIWTQSLALLSDSWHMISDVLALGLAMAASYRKNKARLDNRLSKSELIVSTINALLMLIVIAWIVYEAIARLNAPKPVIGGYVMLIAFIGLVVNVIVAKKLHSHHDKDSLNHRAALIHVMGDLLGSVAALSAGVIIYLTGWLKIDPILSLFIALLLLVVTLGLIKDIFAALSGKNKSQDRHKH